MTRKLSLLAVVLLSTACARYNEPVTRLGAEQRDATYNFAPDAARDHLSPAEADAFGAWLSAFPPAGLSWVRIETADPAMLESAKAGEVMEHLRRAGIANHRLRLTTAPDAGALRVHLSGRVWALPPDCPNWAPAGDFNERGTLSSHLGCATAKNMALQVADPNDLVRGHSDPQSQTESSVRAVTTYMAGGPAPASSSTAEAPSTE